MTHPVVNQPVTVRIPLVGSRPARHGDGKRLQEATVVRHAIRKDAAGFLIQPR
ncbi:MAG: hypothetical protein U0903_14660 [Planctomycetales bacterium]